MILAPTPLWKIPKPEAAGSNPAGDVNEGRPAGDVLGDSLGDILSPSCPSCPVRSYRPATASPYTLRSLRSLRSFASAHQAPQSEDRPPDGVQSALRAFTRKYALCPDRMAGMGWLGSFRGFAAGIDHGEPPGTTVFFLSYWKHRQYPACAGIGWPAEGPGR